MTILHEHVVGNTPDDSVAIKVANGQLTSSNPIAFVEAKGAIIKLAFVDHFVVCLVPIQSDAFEDDIGDVGALKQREIGGNLRIAFEMETFLETAVEFEAIAPSGDQRSLNDVGAFAVGIFADETNAVANLKSFRIGQGDFLIP